MIRLVGLTKIFRLQGQHKVVADNLNITFPSRTSIALLGRNGAGKSTLLKLISGTMRPDAGQVISTGAISWPVGFSGSFHPDLSGLQNTRFIARVYGVDSDELVDYVRDFAELGPHFTMPVRTYSSGMRSRLAFGISMGIAFDTYLVDEVTSVGDAAFRQKSDRVFAQRMQEAGAIVVSHAMEYIRQNCVHGAVLEDGRLVYHTNVDDAIRHHNEVMRSPAAG
jgi:capsular polysaccharide transport system ATP-binding protein